MVVVDDGSSDESRVLLARFYPEVQVIALPQNRGLAVAVNTAFEATGGEYVVLPWSEIGELTAQIEGWERAGGTHVSIVTMGRGLDSVDGHIDLLSTLADELGRPRPSSSQT